VETKQYLEKTLSLAKQYKGFCAPNPAVGALVVKDGKIIAEGAHKGPGKPHAEVEALSQLTQEQSQGATLYVSLEPCCMYGRTPPCTQLIIERGITQVYYGFQDPNPKVSGQGEQQLKQAGVACEQVDLPAINTFYNSYRYWWQNEKPFTTIKLAISADNKIALAENQPCQITGEQAKAFTHEKRLHCDAILSTVKTVMADNPQFNARVDSKLFAKPLYLLDKELKLPVDVQVHETARNITVFYEKTAATQQRLLSMIQKGIRCIPIHTDAKGNLNLGEVIQHIGQDGMHDLWVEAGAKCFSAFLENNLAQRVYLYQSKKALGPNAYPKELPKVVLEQNYKPLFDEANEFDSIKEADLT
jgi:diaminohydroxyphosphoribosylaminopyrimidine deaminase/5-amino-6-(5-phosphoribosylamino)uracil reductase